jgi:prefoldin subunit 5
VSHCRNEEENPMPLTSEQVERELEELRKVCRELSDRVAHLQKRLGELEQAVYEEESEQKNPEE